MGRSAIRRVVAGFVLASLVGCGGDDDRSGADPDAVGPSVSFGAAFEDEIVWPGRSSFLVVGPGREGGLAAAVIEAGDGVRASEVRVAAPTFKIGQLGIHELGDHDWLVTGYGCDGIAEGCTPDALYAFRITGRDPSVEALGPVAGVTGASYGIQGRLDERRVLLSEGSQVDADDGSGSSIYTSRFVTFDLESREVEVVDWVSPPIISPGAVVSGPGSPPPAPTPARSTCVTDGALLLLDAVPVGDGREYRLVSVPVDDPGAAVTATLGLPATTDYGRLTCPAGQDPSVVTVEEEAKQVSVHRLTDELAVADPVGVTWAHRLGGITMIHGTVFVSATTAELDLPDTKEAAQAALDAQGFDQGDAMFFRYADGAWTELAPRIEVVHDTWINGDGTALLVREAGTNYVAVLP